MQGPEIICEKMMYNCYDLRIDDCIGTWMLCGTSNDVQSILRSCTERAQRSSIAEKNDLKNKNYDNEWSRKGKTEGMAHACVRGCGQIPHQGGISHWWGKNQERKSRASSLRLRARALQSSFTIEDNFNTLSIVVYWGRIRKWSNS